MSQPIDPAPREVAPLRRRFSFQFLHPALLGSMLYALVVEEVPGRGGWAAFGCAAAVAAVFMLDWLFTNHEATKRLLDRESGALYVPFLVVDVLPAAAFALAFRWARASEGLWPLLAATNLCVALVAAAHAAVQFWMIGRFARWHCGGGTGVRPGTRRTGGPASRRRPT